MDYLVLCDTKGSEGIFISTIFHGLSVNGDDEITGLDSPIFVGSAIFMNFMHNNIALENRENTPQIISLLTMFSLVVENSIGAPDHSYSIATTRWH